MNEFKFLCNPLKLRYQHLLVLLVMRKFYGALLSYFIVSVVWMTARNPLSDGLKYGRFSNLADLK